MATPSKWMNSTVTLHAGKLTEISKHVPAFDRRPFALIQTGAIAVRDNARLDTIVRLPLNGDDDCVPIGVVSKDYALLQHSSVLDEAVKRSKRRESIRRASTQSSGSPSSANG